MDGNPKKNLEGLSAVETFVQSAPGCQGIDALLGCFVDVIEASNLVDQIIIILVDPDDPEPRLAIGSGLDQSQLEDLLVAVYARLIDGTGEDVPIHMRSDNSKSIYIGVDAANGGRIGLFATCVANPDTSVEPIERNLRLLVDILNISMGKTDQHAGKLASLEQITNAKHQWEITVDNLRDLVCLLDQSGKVVRANKVLETWGLGSVKRINGVGVHDMLHPDCSDNTCNLRNAWEVMWRTSVRSRYEESELFDHIGNRDIRLSLRRRDWDNPAESKLEDFSIFVVEDVSNNKFEERLVGEYNEELYRKLNNQTEQLQKLSAELKREMDNHNQARKVLRKSESIRQKLSARMLTAQEEERKRIASELHDGIGQSISAIKFGLERMLIENDKRDLALEEASIQATVVRLQSAVEEVRRISRGLRPSILDDLGLSASLRWLCQEFQSIHKDIQLDVKIDVEEKLLTEFQIDMIFRITQEALNNISKHSQAEAASLWLTSSQGRIILEVKDDGVGFDRETAHLGEGFGLRSIQERVGLSDGIVSIESKESEGTVLRAVWCQPAVP